MTRRVVLPSLSAAMDGGFTAIADVATAMAASGASDPHRFIGGVAVMLHVQRLALDIPLRATGDADFGGPPHVLREPDSSTRSRRWATPKSRGTGGSGPSMTAASPQSTC